jgi:beta-galactosidase
MVHVLPHWNWEGMEGKEIPVFTYTNADEAELFVNEKSYGKKVKGEDLTPIPSEFHFFEKGIYNSKYRLSWSVPFEAGEVKVVAYKNGKEVAVDKRRTAGAAAKVILEADRSVIDADGKDLSYITIKIVDENGIICPNADNLVEFNIEGAGKLAAVGNGDQTSLQSFKEPRQKAFHGLCLLIVRSDKTAGEIRITANADGLKSSEITIKSSK